MSGHNKWTQIKHQKGANDQKRGQLFSKLLNSIAIAARSDSNPDFNPRLRAAILKAKDANVPQNNIERALKKALDKSDRLEELLLEAYGPGGIAILLEAITDNKNRTVAEIKKILNDAGGRWAETGSVTWAFEKNRGEEERWKAKFPQALSLDDSLKLKNLMRALENYPDTQKVFTNASS